MSGHNINYKKIYYTLLVLLVISVAGPFLGIFWITMLTAFGIALVKANLVIQNFMHLREERRIIKWILVTSLVLMALMVAGVAPDVYKHDGQNWENIAAKAAVARGIDDGAADHAATDDAAADHADEEADNSSVASGFDARGAYNGICAACHGTAGDGAGPAGGAMNPQPTDFTDAAFWADRDDARIFNVIKNGAAAVGGSPSMVGWSTTYDDEQIEGLVQYINSEFRPH